MDELFNEFLRIAKALNNQQKVPLLMGSLGLSLLTNHDFQPKDIDIHVKGHPDGWSVPCEVQIDSWPNIVSIMHELGYTLIDLHEHEFHKASFVVQYGSMNSLPAFAKVSLNHLVKHKMEEVIFLTPSVPDYLKIYQASSQDSYRGTKNNYQDIEKIHFISQWLAKNIG